MTIGDHQELIQLLVTNLGNHNLFLGYDWLQKHNPSINQRDSLISLQNCRQWCRKIYVPKELEEIENEDVKEKAIKEEEKVLFVNLEEEAWRREELSIRSQSESMEEVRGNIPEEYKDFNDQVFNKAVFKKLPDRSKWDHAIELIPNTMLKDCKVYPLNVKKQKDVTNFIWPYLHQFFINSHGLNGYGKPSKRPFDRYQSRFEAINNGRDIRQINW